MVRVLLADNFEMNRVRLRGLLRADSQIEVVGEATCGADAVQLVRRLRPQVVVMGALERSPALTKPVDGLEAARRIMAETPTPIVVALPDGSDLEARGQALLKAGAVAVLSQARLSSPGLDGAVGHNELVETVRIMSAVKVVRQRMRTPQPNRTPKAQMHGVDIVAIAASTGGPHAITHVLKALPARLPVPVVIVQHMAHGFVRGFTKWLDGHCALPVKLVDHTERMRPGVAYVAADGAHLRVMRHVPSGAPGHQSAPFYALHPSKGEPQDGFMPSASVLFESVAEAFGERALAVILTGMGRDGLSGLAKVREHGGRILAQNQETSVVFGMPSVAIEAGLADLVLPIDQMATQILELVHAKESQ